MKRVIKYVAFDGTEFTTPDAVKKYEAEWQAINRLKEILEVSIRSGRADALIRHVVLEAESVQDALMAVVRMNKKAKKEKIARE
jgi:hypothetical protein